MEIIYGFVFILILILIWVVLTYNRLISLRNSTRTAFGQVETQLQLRLDLIPSLVATVQGYADHENSTLKEVIQARANAMQATTPSEIERSEATLVGSLGKLMLLTENYPNLKADTSFLNFQYELSRIEGTINFARRFYNENVNVYNTSVESFPAIVIANSLGFSRFELFKASQNAEVPPTVTFKGRK
jgi:LemA protein